MSTEPETGPERAAHANGLGFLRLIFAGLVIVSHTPELTDGDRHRELLTMIVGTISFGELAVDCFFVISGYLIVASYEQGDPARRVSSYLRKRVARIYPGFVVASLLSLLVFAPLGGADLGRLLIDLPAQLRRIAFLQLVDVPDVFAGMPYSGLNSAVWTIPYEFACYLLVILLGMTGMLRRPALVAALAATLLFAWALIRPDGPDEALRLTGIFLTGSLFHLWRARLRFTRRGCGIAAAGLAIGLALPAIAEIAVATFGGYLIFAFARWSRETAFARINNQDDISYGVYLYGWPIGSVLIWRFPAMPLATTTILTLLAACACGWASWRYVERPAMRRWGRRAPGIAPPQAAIGIA